MITFLQYLCENVQISDQQILEIANFVTSKVKYILSQNVASDNFVAELQKVWNGYYPSNDIKVRFEFVLNDKNAGSYRFENNEHVISISLDSLYGNGSLETFTQALVHELQHINSPGANGDSLDTIEDKLKFYTNYGEVESHAKQFGWLFKKHYPGNAFNVSLLLQLYTKLKNDPNYGEKEGLYKILLYCFPTKTKEYQESTPAQKQRWLKLQKTFTQKIADFVGGQK